MAYNWENRGVKRKFGVLSEKPGEINIVQYAQSRASEIEALAADIKTRTGNKLVFQFLPRNLRRRAMSHNIKRLPRRLQGLAKPEFENRTNTSKCPSRKHRRRPKNLLKEYNRRQRKHVWLETHIWHAKRFKMEDRWGYRIPVHSTDRSIKASYRATQNHCQIQDISYMCCIEITGEEKKILEGLSHLTNQKTGLTFGAKANISGTREGTTTVYKYDRYPCGAIGCVSYLWKPLSNQDDSEDNNRQLWVWCHPSCYSELWDQLYLCFKCNVMDTSMADTGKDSGVTEKHKTFSIGDITVTSLKDMLNRHRLTGPAANQIIYEVLQPANILEKESNNHWWQKYYQNSSLSMAFTQQGEFIESLGKTSSPGEYMPHSVIGITVGDPRISRPDKRVKVTQNMEDVETDITICSERLIPDVSMSALWYSNIREEIKTTKMSDQQLNELKSDIFIPGALHDIGIEESRIPVMLIQRPGVRQGTRINYGCGWDVILPPNWSMGFWLACIYRGARAAGVRELQSLALEQRMSYFPNDYPDTPAGQLHEKSLGEQLKSKFDKRPPAKRCNYVKLGICEPFSYPWEALIKTWNDGDTEMNLENMYVLRDSKALKVIDQLFNTTKISFNRNTNMKSSNNGSRNKVEINENQLSKVFSDHKQSIIHIEVKMVLRGVPDEHAIICIPTSTDLETLAKQKSFDGPKEPVHKDMGKELKKKKKKLHTESKEQSTASVEVKRIRNSCSRDIIGFVNHGGFSFASGNGIGLGFCSLAGLQKLLQQSSEYKMLVLVRNPTSYQYRFAYMSVII